MPPARRSAPSRRLIPWIVVAVGLLASWLGAAWQQRHNDETVHERLESLAALIAAQVERRLARVELGLLGTRGAVAAIGADRLDRQAFQRYIGARDIDREFPGVRGLGFIQRVPLQDEAAFLATAAADGWPGFKIRQLTPHGQERYVIRYIYPVERNREAVGLDVGSEANRRRAADTSALTGRATLTGPITLVQATGRPRAGFLLLLPAFRGDEPLRSDARAGQSFGWVYAPLVIHEVLAGIDVLPSTVQLQIGDVEDGRESAFYRSDDEGAPEVEVLDRAQVEQAVLGRTWRVSLAATPAFVQAQRLVRPLAVGAVGSLFSVLFGIAVAVAMRNREQARELAKERNRRATAVQASGDAMVFIDPAGRIVDWNHGAERLLGHRADEAIGRDAIELLVPPADRPWAGGVLQRAETGDAPPVFESQRLHKDGSAIDVSILVTPMRDEAGGFTGLALAMRDIRDAKAAQREIQQLNATLEAQVQQRTEALNDALRELQTVLDATPSLIGYWDRHLRCRLANRAYVEWFGVPHDRAIGMHARELIGEPLYQAALPHMQMALAGEVQQFEESWPAHATGGAPRHALVNYLPDRVGDEVRGYFAFVHDVTELTDARLKLAAARAHAEAANLAKSRFLANMSHEIRTPMNAVLGLAFLLRQTKLDADQARFVDRIRLAGDTLLAIINDVLDLSKVEAGELTLSDEVLDLRRLLTDALAVAEVQAQAKALPLLVDLDPSLPARVRGDGLRITQVLVNLLTNAVKFTQRGQVQLAARWSTDGAAGSPADGHLHLEVQDSGIGIEADALRHIFEPFTQADGTTTRRFGGTGLGLSIVKRIVELMGGRIAVESAPGVGTTFRVDLPLSIAAGDAADTATHAPTGTVRLDGCTLLVVDDSDINRDVARRILESHGARVLLAEHGEQALSMLSGQPGRVDLVLMDLHMPVMDGFEATRRLRQQPGLASLPVLALSAGVTTDEREAARAAGLDEFIAKPFDPQRLLRLIAQRLQLAGPGAADAAAASAPSLAASPAWPTIEGIDRDDARARLGGDEKLFRSMLRRLIEQSPEVRWQGELTDPGAREAAIHTVHKLSGTSGTLGARTVHAHAAALERLLREGDGGARAEAMRTRLNRELARLRVASEAYLAGGERRGAEPAGAPAAPLEPARLNELTALLRQSNIRAIDAFEALSPALRAAMPADGYDRLNEHVQELRFDAALDLLEALPQT